jgi:hypothetical protein
MLPNSPKVKIRWIDSERVKEGQSVFKGLLFDKDGRCLGIAPYIEKEFPRLELKILPNNFEKALNSGDKTVSEVYRKWREKDFPDCWTMAELEREWQESQPRLTEKECLDIFPEAKKVIPEKIREWEERRDKVVEVIKKKLILIREKTFDEFSRWFWREWVKVNEGEVLLEIDRQIARLKTLLLLSKGKLEKGITDEMIQKALLIPIGDIASQHTKLKRVGKNLVGLCPLHQERNPSFYLYPETNSFWCYGCQKGGDVIKFVELIHGYSFKEAVKYLNRR